MWRCSSILLLMAAACSRGPEADLQYVGQARSAAAEWALVNEQASQGKLTDTYVASMHKWMRDQIRSASVSLTQPNSRYGEEIRALLAEPEDSAPDALRGHADKLKQIEDELESA